MVDRWLIAAADQAEKVMRRGENHQQGDERDADPEADFLRSLAQRASSQALEGVESEVSAVQQGYWQEIHQAHRY